VSGIGVVVALPREMPARFVRSGNRLGAAPHLFTVYCSTSAANRHVAVQAGMGRTRAAAATRLLIQRFSPQGIMSFGFAGGLVSELARGALIIGTEVVCEDGARQWTMACRNLVEQFSAAADAEGLLTHQGILVTSRHIVTDPTAKADLRAESGACAVDMETAGIVEAADEAGLPWVALRAIVDSASDALSPVCLATLREDGHVAIGRLLWMIGRSPPALGHIVRLARDTAVARRHLSRVFERWAQSHVVQCPPEPGVIPR
jgi:adenosylhomocysteine nucleosidase